MQRRNGGHDQAEENARELIKRAGRATRRRFNPEEKVRVVMRGSGVRYLSVPCAEGKVSRPASSTSG